MGLDTARAIATIRGLTAKFDTRRAKASPFYPRIANVRPSSGADEKYGFIGTMPGMREWLGDRVFEQLRAGDYTIANKEFESSVAILKNDIDDDRLGMYDLTMEAMADEAAHHPDELLFDLLVNGESQACFDGQYFFDTDHSWGKSGTQSNDLTYDGSTTVTEAEFRAAYHAARAAMLSFKGDNGKFFHRPTLEPITDLLLLVPPGLQEVATQAINKQLVSGGETNVILDKPAIVAIPHLTSSSKFYLLRVGQALKPFVFQMRRPLRRQMKGLEDHEFKDVKFMTDARYNCGYLAWWNAVLTTFT